FTAAFPLGAATTATTAQDAVYAFFYNANLLRHTVYAALTGVDSASGSNLENWAQGVINTLKSPPPVQDNTPDKIATTIATGQGQQVTSIHVNVPRDSQKQPIGEILAGGAIAAAAAFLAAIPGLGETVSPVLVLSAAAVLGGGSALGQSFVGNAFASG